MHYDVPGSARMASANTIGAYPAYKAAPTFAYTIGDYTLDRQGILTGPHNACSDSWPRTVTRRSKKNNHDPGAEMPGVVFNDTISICTGVKC